MRKGLLDGMTSCGTGNGQHYQLVMNEAVRMAAAWLEDGTLFNGETPQALGARLKAIEVLPESGVGDTQALADAAQMVLASSLQVHHPLCIAHLHCPTTLSSQGAEVLLNAANQSMDSWDQSPAATVLEQHMLSWLRHRLGYGSEDAGVFTSGGTQSNLMGLLLARDRAVAKYWKRSVREQGLPSDAVRLKVVCSEKAHFSVRQALYLLGLGGDACVSVATDSHDRIDTRALEATLGQLTADGQIVFAIVATAGTTDAGAIDPLPALADCAARYDTWLHVDAAWGGALLLSGKYRDRLNGIERADSVTLDFHKHFFQPISCSAFLLKDGSHFNLMREHADYLNPAEDEALGIPNLVERSLQTTRRFDALKLWASLRSIGARRFGHLVDAGIDLASEVAKAIENDPAFELIHPPQLASVLFRLRAPHLDELERDSLHQSVAYRLLNEGIANLGVTRRDGRTALKMTLLNPATEMSHIVDLMRHLKRVTGEYGSRSVNDPGSGSPPSEDITVSPAMPQRKVG